MNLEVISKYGKSFSIVRVPYSFKLLIQELQVMNIQMRIITEDNIDQLTSMNYAKTIQNLTLAKLSLKEEQDYNKKYDGKMLQAKPKTTRQIIAEDTEPLMIDLDKKGPIISDSKGEGEGEGEDEDDNDGLSQVTIDSIKRAEDEFSRYQDLDDYDGEDEEREPIKIGDVVNNDELGIENLNNEKQEQTQEQTQTQDQTQSIVAPPIEKEPVLENITTTSPAQDEKANVEKSGNMKTIVINNQ
jgi:DNA-directed RNA polymerase II subunit RPB2